MMYNNYDSTTPSNQGYPNLRLPTPDPQYGMSSSPAPDIFSSRRLTFSVENIDRNELVRHPHVRDLMNCCSNGVEQLARQVENNANLIQQVFDLQRKNIELKQRLLEQQNQLPTLVSATKSNTQVASATHTNGQSGSSSTTVGAAPQGDEYRSSIHLPHYPESIIWAFEDCIKQNLVMDANKSRPNMKQCICDETGQMIGNAAYNTIKTTARRLIQTIFFKLPTPADPDARYVSKTKTYFRKYHPDEYQVVLVQLEDSDRLLKLCAPNWKADHIIQQSLQSIGKKDDDESDDKEPNGKKLGEKPGKRKQSEDIEAACVKEGTKGSIADDGDKENIQNHSAKKMRMKEGGKGESTRISHHVITHAPWTPFSKQLLTLGAEKPYNQLKNVAAPSVSMVGQATSTGTQVQAEAHSTASPPRTIDVKFILVDPSISSLRGELTSLSLIPTVACATDLLEAMEKNRGHFDGQPSEGLLSLISAIESADPNAPDMSEDKTNANWGHRQLSGKWRGVLMSWESVGNCAIACCLIAAIVKTCKVAQHLCYEHKLESSSYLCVSYLQEIIEKLWDCWKEAGGPIVKGKEVDHAPVDSGSLAVNRGGTEVGAEGEALAPRLATETVSMSEFKAPSKPEMDKVISSLLIVDLKSWINKFGVAFASNKRTPAKEEYRAAILDSPLSSSQSSYAELQALSQERKNMKKKKTTVANVVLESLT